MIGCVISHWLHKDREVTYVGLVIFTVLKKSTVDKEMVIQHFANHVSCDMSTQNLFQTVTFANPLTLVP